MTLTEFLLKHTRLMMQCFYVEHFQVSFQELKTLEGVMFDVYVDYEYLRANIRFGKIVRYHWKHNDRNEIIAGIAHELTHILTGWSTDDLTITKNRRKLIEQETEHISRLLLRLYLAENKQGVSRDK